MKEDYNVGYYKIENIAPTGIRWISAEWWIPGNCGRRGKTSLHYVVAVSVSYLNEAFLLRIVLKFSTKSSERLLSKKSYAADMTFISDREDVVTSQNLGWRLENVVLLELAL